MFPQLSAYHYTLGNPVRYIDPDGRKAEDVILVDGDGNELDRVEMEGEDIYITNLPSVVVKPEKEAGYIEIGSAAVLTGIAADISVPEPTDAVGPKWAVYALAGAVAYGLAKDATDDISIPRDIATTDTSPSPPIGFALSVDEYLFDFAAYTNSLPHSEWGEMEPTETTQRAYKLAIISIGFLPNSQFNFNLSTPRGLITDPVNQKVFAGSFTLMEYQTVQAFPNKTTYWKKSGSIYKKQ